MAILKVPNDDRADAVGPVMPKEDDPEKADVPPVRVLVLCDLRPIEVRGRARESR